MLFIDYAVAVECKNEDSLYICYKCGKCGRKFDSSGIMIDDAGTTVEEEWDNDWEEDEDDDDEWDD